MPNTSERQLTLTNVGTGTDKKVTVTYNAHFTPFERHLAGLGLTFRELIYVMGMDPAGGTTGTILAVFPEVRLQVTDGNTPQTIPRTVSINLSRATLNEDPGTLRPDDDEIRCKILILAAGMPPAVTPDAFTNQVVLQEVGGIFQGESRIA